jgi:SAM-dependent methyltransferase
VHKRVAKYIYTQKQCGEILDVGCATGIFLSQFFNKPVWRRLGVEISHRFAKIASTNNIEVSIGNVHNARFHKNRFDVITVLDTFCYFPDPQRELEEYCRILKPDGLLVLELSLASGCIWRASGRLGRLLSSARQPLLESSDHLFYYNPKSISLLLEKCGFIVHDILPLPANQQTRVLRNLFYTIYSLFASAVCFLSGSTLFFAPRFLVAAVRKSK